MASIKSSGNKTTEQRFVQIIKSLSIVGWRRHWPLFGSPDFVFPKNKIAIFIDGCFWHGCPKHCRMPSSNVEYWNKKISGNYLRDRWVEKDLKSQGWLVYRFWEHELDGCASLTKKLNRLRSDLMSNSKGVKYNVKVLKPVLSSCRIKTPCRH